MKRRIPNNVLDAEIYLVCGGTGSGKSTFVKRKLKKCPRVIVYDIKNEYPFKKIYSPGELLRAVKNLKGKGRFSYVGKVNADTFEQVSKIAFIWGNCAYVAEELSTVTNPSKAPAGWHKCITQGRGFGLVVFGVTQRPSESDKTIVAQSNYKWVGSLERAQDRDYMARELDIKAGDMPRETLHYLLKENRALSKGVLKFNKK